MSRSKRTDSVNRRVPFVTDSATNMNNPRLRSTLMTRQQENRKVYHWSLSKTELQVLINYKQEHQLKTLNEALQHLLGLQMESHV